MLRFLKGSVGLCISSFILQIELRFIKENLILTTMAVVLRMTAVVLRTTAVMLRTMAVVLDLLRMGTFRVRIVELKVGIGYIIQGNGSNLLRC